MWLIGVANRNAQFERLVEITKHFEENEVFANSELSVGLRVSQMLGSTYQSGDFYANDDNKLDIDYALVTYFL